MTGTATVASLPKDAVDALAAELGGPVFEPGERGYADELDSFDRSVVHHPVLVVGATTAGDVVAAVRFAAAHRLGVAVQNTGHGVALPADGALFISTRRMTGYRVDRQRATAVLAAGVLWQDVIATAAEYGLAPAYGARHIGSGPGFVTRETLPKVEKYAGQYR